MSERTMGDEPTGDVNNLIAYSLLRYVELALGPEGLQQLVERLPNTSDVEELTRGSRWWPIEEFTPLVAAAYEITGDIDLGRRVGEQSLRGILGGHLADMLKMSETPDVACWVMADYSTKVTKGRVINVVESASDHVVLEGRYTDGAPPNSFSCGFTAGYFSSLPMLFDRLGTCVETACQSRGDEVCRFRVAWRLDPTRTEVIADDDGGLFARGSTALEELENHHRMAARLVESHQIADVLDRVVASVSGTVGAPQYVLAVRLDDDAGRRVHQVGFDGDGAEVLADMLDAGETLGDDCMVVEVRHGDRVFGHLVAVFLPGTNRALIDERMLSSYARFAGAAIQIVEALEAARRDRDTATAMLHLAAALAESSGVQSVISNLCTALPTATGCDVGNVWLVDPESGDAVLVEATDRDGRPLPIDQPPARFDPRNVPVTRQPLVDPVLLDLDHPDVRAAFGDAASPYAEWAIVPIGPIDRLIAVAGATFARPLTPAERGGIGDRLRGLADQAVVAFENARLIEVMRHQALHDDLTGLPKRILAEDRCRQALARRERTSEEVALLFVDIDDFKNINDTHGHARGDELLQAVALRLSAELRSSDTCARVGGDEFVVILTGPAGTAGGAEVAERLTRSLDEPFLVGDTPIAVTASIGIAWAGPDVDTFDQLVTRADAAMYEAKSQGKARLVISN
jgi:diguanylate cyclase (GGDEF)-like protein